MGLVYSDIILSNPVFPDLKSLEVKCLVDTGSVFLCLPSHVAAQLNLKELGTREAVFAVRNSKQVPYVGPVRVTFGNRNCFVGALVIGNEVLLGALPMEDMDLIVHPELFKLTVNPESPNLPRGNVK
jgi:clan AA aspartic protease